MAASASSPRSPVLANLRPRIVPYVIENLMNRKTLTHVPGAGFRTEVWAAGFLSRVCEKGFTRLFHNHPAKDTFVAVADPFLHFDRLCMYLRFDDPPAAPAPTPAPADPAGPPPPPPGRPLPMQPQDLAELFCNLVNHELYPQLGRLIALLAGEMQNVPGVAELRLFWLPFLHALLAMLRKSFIPLPVKQYRPVFRAILEVYAAKFVNDPAAIRVEVLRFDQYKLRELLGPGFVSLRRMAGLSGDLEAVTG